jgi:hypothetical protein
VAEVILELFDSLTGDAELILTLVEFGPEHVDLNLELGELFPIALGLTPEVINVVGHVLTLLKPFLFVVGME